MSESIPFLLFGVNSPALLALVGGIATCLYLCYRWTLPRPIPGIPYNKEATKSILGDIIPMIRYMAKTQEIGEFFTLQNITLKSPIVQLFIRPFGRPFVVITDFRESQDILLRRTKEFDRSKFFGDIFSGLLPEHHLIMPTNDTFKRHRRWLQDLMTPDFLHKTAAPRIYAAFADLINLWSEKSRLAEGHPFAAPEDVYRATLDAVWSVMFGTDPSNNATSAQAQLCSSIKDLNLPSDVDKEVHIPEAPDPPIFKAIVTLAESIETSTKSPVPRLAYWFLRQMPYMRKAIAINWEFVKGEVEKTKNKFMSIAPSEWEASCAIDDIMRREMLLSEKEGRPPMFHSRAMYDEIMGFIVAAHDTTSTTITWTLNSSPITPTYNTNAVTEESIRYSRTTAAAIRTALTNVSVLGHRIPKGTDIFMMSNGPSIFSPSFPISDTLRSPTSLAAKDRVGAWDPDDMGEFKPERWMKDEGGETVFDPAAGPLLTFGLGVRGCFGRRLAYLKLRLLLVLVVWGFELGVCPEGLSGYEAVDKLTHMPQQCYVRLRKL